MDARQKIEAALSGFATFPVWHETSPDDVVHAVRNESARIVADVGYSGDEEFDKTICAYIAAACPAAIREVLQTLASKEAELVRVREAGKLAWRALCDAEAVLVTVDPEDSSESEKLEEIIERVSACAGVLFCELRLPMSTLTQPTE